MPLSRCSPLREEGMYFLYKTKRPEQHQILIVIYFALTSITYCYVKAAGVQHRFFIMICTRANPRTGHL